MFRLFRIAAVRIAAVRPAVVAVCLAAFMAVPALGIVGQAHAKTTTAPHAVIQVNPGPHAIRKALKSANPGDVLNIHTGTYVESVRVKKPNVTLQAAGDGPVIVDAQCDSVTTINLEREGITIKGLMVRGATYYAINVEHLETAYILKNTVTSTCAGAPYGVNVFDGGAIQVIGNKGTGWTDAVIYIGGINDTGAGTLLVKKTNAATSLRGIIIEDSPSTVNIKVFKNNVHDNTDTGILIHNSDGVLVDKNNLTNNGTNGVHLDSTSDENTVSNNTISGHTYDLNNEGTNNCFIDNTYTTSNGTIAACAK